MQNDSQTIQSKGRKIKVSREEEGGNRKSSQGQGAPEGGAFRTTSKFQDLTGMTFGRLTVIGLSHKDRSPSGQVRSFWKCKCECGGETRSAGLNLRSGGARSCGCLMRENVSKANFRHGHSGRSAKDRSPEYISWGAMIQRCTNPKNLNFHNYGGRGIKVCARWLESFENFYLDIGARPSIKHSIDRINNEGNYDPGNCRWATHSVQCNNRRGNHLISFGGKTQTIAQWAREIGIRKDSLRVRLTRCNWSIKDALGIPVSRHKISFTINGRTMPATHWAKHFGVPIPKVYRRISRGITDPKIIFNPNRTNAPR